MGRRRWGPFSTRGNWAEQGAGQLQGVLGVGPEQHFGRGGGGGGGGEQQRGPGQAHWWIVGGGQQREHQESVEVEDWEPWRCACTCVRVCVRTTQSL